MTRIGGLSAPCCRVGCFLDKQEKACGSDIHSEAGSALAKFGVQAVVVRCRYGRVPAPDKT